MADFGDFLRGLFGGSEQTAQSSQQATQASRAQQSGSSASSGTGFNITPDAYQGLTGPLADVFKQLLGQASSAPPTYQGPLTADLGGNEASLLSKLMGTPTSSAGASSYTNDVLGGKYLPGQGGNPFLDAAIKSAQRPTLQGLEETLGRTLPGRFTQAGQLIQANGSPNSPGGGSSAFDRAAAIATRGAADAIGDIATKISAGNYEAERGRQQEAVGQSAQLQQQDIDNTIKNLQAQALPRLIQENGIERGMALFQQNTQKLLDVLKTIGAISGATVANTSQSSSTSQGTSSSEGQSTGVSASSGTNNRGAFPALFPNGL